MRRPAACRQGTGKGPKLLTQLRLEHQQVSLVVRLVLAASIWPLIWSTAPHLFLLAYGPLAVYSLYSVALIAFGQKLGDFTDTRALHWIDVVFYVYLAAVTDGSSAIGLLLPSYPILVAAFRWGFGEGMKVTVVCAVAFTLVRIVAAPEAAPWTLTFSMAQPLYLLPFGYLVAYWGGNEIRLERRLRLLQEVSNVWNPRFGIDQTIGANLDRLVAFYGARACIMVLRSAGTASRLLMYTAMPGTPVQSMLPREITADTAAELLRLPQNCGLLYSDNSGLRRLWAPRTTAYDVETGARVTESAGSADLGALLEADHFVSVPYGQRDGTVGRIFLTADWQIFMPSDVFFLAQTSGALSSVAENMFLMDELISRATEYERLNVSRDIHDTTIQPYIGIKLALEALAREAPAGGEISKRVNEIVEMVSNTVRGLRTYANNLREKPVVPGEFLVAAVQREAQHFSRFYGLDVEVAADIKHHISGRIAAEAFQIISEGLSNVLKHSQAKRATIDIKCANSDLMISIRNEGQKGAAGVFTPRSVLERARSLNGTAEYIPMQV